MDVIGSDRFSMLLAERLGARHIPIERRLFPDGEACPRLIGKPAGEVIVAERMGLPLYPNRYLAELLLTLKNLRYMNVEDISVVMPYFVYSRQDRSFRPGEPFSARHVLDMLHDCGTGRLFTVASHMERFKEQLTAPMPAYNIDGYSILGSSLQELDLREPLVMGPDMSVSMAASRVASMLEAESLSLEKHRDHDTGELSVRQLNKCMDSRDIVIIDDIISSGGTMLKAIETAKRAGCGRIVVASVHAVQQAGIDRLRKHAWKILSTDTVDTPVSEVSVIGTVADAISGRPGVDTSGMHSAAERGVSVPDTPAETEPAAGAFSMFD